MNVGNLMNGLGGGLGTIANWGTQLVDSGKSQVNTVGMNYNNAGLNNISDLSNFQANTFDTGDIVAPNKAAQAANVFTSMGEGALAGSSINVPWGTIAGAAAGLAKGTAQAFIQNDTYHNDIARANRFNNNSRKTAVKLAGQASNNIVNNSYNSMRFNNEFAEGGDLSYGMPNIDIINSGGTHEGNPNMGVAYGVDNQGTPNKVEEGEVVVELSSGEKVVISDRVISSREDGLKNNVPSFDGKISCAQMAKKIIESFKDRKDPYSKKTMNALLERIYNTQEYTKIRQEAESQGMTAEEYIQMQQEQEAYAQQQMLAQQQAQQAQSQDQMQDQGYDEDMMYSNGSDQQAAMIQQLAQEYGVSPEEIMQMMAQQQGGEVPQEEIPQENMNAYGGNLYATGGRKKKFGFSHYKEAYPWIDRDGYKALRDGLFVGESGDDYFYGSNLDGYINDIQNKALGLEDPEHLSPETRAQLIKELSTPRLIDPEDPESDINGGLLLLCPNPIKDEAIKHNYSDKSRREFKKEINNPVYGYTKIARKNLLDYYDKKNPSVLAEAFNTASSIGGFIPGPGDAIDMANAVVQANQGNWVDAGLSAFSAVPLAGIFGNLAKLFKSGQKLRRAKAYIDGAYTYAKIGKYSPKWLNETYGLTGRHKLPNNFQEIIRDEKKLAKKINVDGLPHKTEDYLQALKEIKPDKDVTTKFKTTNINGEPVTIIKNGNDNSIEVRENGATIIFTKSNNNKDYKVQQKSLNDSGTEVVTTITGTKADEYKKVYETFLSSKYSNNTITTLTKDGEIIRVSKSDNSTTTEYFDGVTSTYYNKTGDTKVEFPNGDKVISKKQKENGVLTGKYEINVTDTEGNESVYYADKEPTTDGLRGYVKTHNTTFAPTPTGKPAESMAEPANNNAANTNAAESTPTNAKPTTESTGAKSTNGTVESTPTGSTKSTEPTTEPEYGIDETGRVFRVNKPTTNPTETPKPVTTEPTTSKPTTESTGAKSAKGNRHSLFRDSVPYIFGPTRNSKANSTAINDAKRWAADNGITDPKLIHDEYISQMSQGDNAKYALWYPTASDMINNKNLRRNAVKSGQVLEWVIPVGLGSTLIGTAIAGDRYTPGSVPLYDPSYDADAVNELLDSVNARQSRLENGTGTEEDYRRLQEDYQKAFEINRGFDSTHDTIANPVNKEAAHEYRHQLKYDVYALGGSLSNSLPEYDQYLLRRSRINSDPNLFASGGPATINFPKNFLGPMNQFGGLNILTSNNNFSTHQSSMSMDNNNNTNRSKRITSQDRKLLSEPSEFDNDELNSLFPQNQASPLPNGVQERLDQFDENNNNNTKGLSNFGNFLKQENPLQYAGIFDALQARMFPDKIDHTYEDQLKGSYNPYQNFTPIAQRMRTPETNNYSQLGLHQQQLAGQYGLNNSTTYNNNLGRALNHAAASKGYSAIGDVSNSLYLSNLNNQNSQLSMNNKVNATNRELDMTQKQYNDQLFANSVMAGYAAENANRDAWWTAQHANRNKLVDNMRSVGEHMRDVSAIESNPMFMYDPYNMYKSGMMSENTFNALMDDFKKYRDSSK